HRRRRGERRWQIGLAVNPGFALDRGDRRRRSDVRHWLLFWPKAAAKKPFVESANHPPARKKSRGSLGSARRESAVGGPLFGRLAGPDVHYRRHFEGP